MNEKIKNLIEDSVSSFIENINWSEYVGPAVTECVEVNTKSDFDFVNKIVENICDHLENNFSTEKLTEEIVDELNKRNLIYRQTPSVEGGGAICSKCYRPTGVWVSEHGHQIQEYTVMVNGKSIILTDDF